MNFQQLVENTLQNFPPAEITAGEYLYNAFGLKPNTRKEFGDLNCAHKPITSLKGLPRRIYTHHIPGFKPSPGNLNASYCRLTTLVGAPVYIEGSFNVFGNRELKSAKGFPGYVGGNFVAINTKLTENELAKHDVGLKVKGEVYLEYGTPLDKNKLTRAYLKLKTHTDTIEQQELGEI